MKRPATKRKGYIQTKGVIRKKKMKVWLGGRASLQEKGDHLPGKKRKIPSGSKTEQG